MEEKFIKINMISDRKALLPLLTSDDSDVAELASIRLKELNEAIFDLGEIK